MERARRLETYENFSTAPAYIRVRIRNSGSDQTATMILENTDLAGFMSRKQGMTHQGYVDFMLKNGDTPLDLDIPEFETYLTGSRFRSMAVTRKHLAAMTCSEPPMTLQDLNVQTKEELVTKYFLFDERTQSGRLNLFSAATHDPRFIGLLMDLGYVVGRGDYVPIIYIHAVRGSPTTSTGPSPDKR